ncbi:hypothetical protein L218DRAFT_830685, partial [Marasmius fiardii PR-910]
QDTQPTLQQSWDVIMKVVSTNDEDLVSGYKEDIDTRLVFAGLFSAVVTAFTIESYQWLQEDPADSTVERLRQISQQIGGQSIPSTSSPPDFAPSGSVIRINTFWFLSLILALIDALFGLFCKQWLHEHQRQTRTRTPGQTLALSWLHNRSFDWWHVPTILASLPILLELALFLFFAGLLELLWTLHPIPSAIASVFIGLAVLFYLRTTVLPGIHITYQALQINPLLSSFEPDILSHLPPIQSICPYKSPQSWLMFHLFSTLCLVPGYHPTMTRHYLYQMIKKNLLDLSNWPLHDLNVVQRFSNIDGCPDLYELKGFRWLVQKTWDIPSMLPHLKNVLGELPPHLVMPAIFEQWVPSGKPSWSGMDIE